MTAEPSTCSHGRKKTFCASNATADEVNQSDIEYSDSLSYIDTDRETNVDRIKLTMLRLQDVHLNIRRLPMKISCFLS
jgi:hypothetical protein